LKEDLQIFDFSLADEEVLQLSDMSTSVAGRLSAVADVAVPVGGAVGGALLISSVLDSLDAKGDDKPTAAAAKKATLPEPEKKKKKSEDEDEDDDDGAL